MLAVSPGLDRTLLALWHCYKSMDFFSWIWSIKPFYSRFHSVNNKLVLAKGICHLPLQRLGFPGGTMVKNLPANAGDARYAGSNPWVRKTPWRRKWQPTPVFFPGKFHGQRSLVAYSPRVAKSQTQLSDSAHTHTRDGTLCPCSCWPTTHSEAVQSGEWGTSCSKETGWTGL